MLVHLSKTSPYVCDLNQGSIEPANRMASAPAKKATALLEQKESFQKQTRTPLKLLATDEIPMDTTATTTDINASLQPVWYTEQTIVDEQHGQHEDIASIIQEQQGKSLLSRSTLPPIQSESPVENEEIEELPNQPSLMHKSSTFTIEPSINVDSPLNDSEKENAVTEDTTNAVIPPSDDSFRALEQLLGLGSTTTVRESPKTNHDTLSLTVVTPTDIINSTRRSSRLSIAQKGGAGSQPSSQDIPTMPTIESITSTNPPSFLMDNTTMEEEQPSIAMTTSQQTTFDLTDNDTMKDDSNNDDETNFSFELNDFPNNSNDEPKVEAPTQPMMTIRAPTCADVAYRALIKPRTGGGRVSQPVKADSPLAKPTKARSSAPLTRGLRSSAQPLPSSSAATESVAEEQPAPTDTKLIEVVTLPEEDQSELDKTSSITLNTTSPKETECTIENTATESGELVTPPKPMSAILSREYTYDTPKRRSTKRGRSTLNSSYATPTVPHQPEPINEEEVHSPAIPSKSMLNILMTKPTEAVRKSARKASFAPSPAESSTPITTSEQLVSSPAIASKSMLEVLLTKPTDTAPKAIEKTSIVPSPIRSSKRKTMTQQVEDSPSIPSKSMLEVLLTKPTKIATPTRVSKRNTAVKQTTDSPAIAFNSMLQVLLTKPSEPKRRGSRRSASVSTPVRPSKRNTAVKQTVNSPAIASNSMLQVLLTKPTEPKPRGSRRSASVSTPIRPSKRNTTVNQTSESPAIESNSMLGVLLTNPTENNASVAPSPVPSAAQNGRRSSSNATPRASINPLHSSTPAATPRHKSLQLVCIGEQEQVTTTVPHQVNIEIQRDDADVEMVSVNETTVSIEQPSTLERGVQTTPSLDKFGRHYLHVSEQQTTPNIQINKSSSSMVVVNEEEEQITPIQTKVVVNLQRSVRFQLTPGTDARLVAKEQLEEALCGLKPDIVIPPTPIILEPQSTKVKAATIKKAAKPKKKVIASKKKKVSPKKKVEPKPKPMKKKPTIRKEKVATPAVKEPKKTTKQVQPNQTTPKKTTKPVARKTSTKQTTVKATTNAIAKRAAPKATAKRIAKRTTQKRTIPKAALESVLEHTKPKQPTTEVKVVPVVKSSSRKQTTSKAKPKPVAKPTAPKETSAEVKTESVAAKRRVPSKRTTKEVPSEPVAKRASVKRTIPETKTESKAKRIRTSKPVEEKKPSTEVVPSTNLRKTRRGASSTAKTVPQPVPKMTNKRRLPSIEKNEESRKKMEKKETESAQPTEKPIPQENDQQKIEGLTVAQLKSRLNKHKENIPKGAKKADLIALLMKLETNSRIKPIEVEPTTIAPTTKTTRRRKN
ncbi:unnamed protein product [Adineta ricciae]|uniref:SAP domain-containing protein n=1 Tax=Adineta ricciae TaxID=249248 RepID=A0A814BKA9_ADIRI|nr:unnamed protein product [Adineta ricciae]